MHILSTRAQLVIGAALILLMAVTRGQHFASVENLPSASWSIFFLAGFLARIAEYVPRHLGNLAFYVGTALVPHVGIVSAQRLLRTREVH